MTDWYYYYQLNNKCRDLYKRLLSGIEHRHMRIMCDDLEIDSLELPGILHAVEYDNPHLFYVDYSNLEYHTVLNKVFGVQIKYLYSEKDCKELQAVIDKSLKRIIERIAVNECSDLQKVWKLHDFLIDNVSYFHDALSHENTFEWHRAHSILGLFLDKRAVCSGISRAFKYVLNKIGVRSIVVDGTALNEKNETEGHEWNIVKIGDFSYHIDLTWDIAMSLDGLRSYDYFNLSDDLIFKDHFTNSKLPVCHSDKDNYFSRNGYVINNQQDWGRYFAVCESKKYGDYYVRIDYQCDFNKEIERIQKYIMKQNAFFKTVEMKIYTDNRQGIIRVKVLNG